MLLDANLLIYALTEQYDQHATVGEWLWDALERGTRIGVPTVSALAFVRITSNRRLFAGAMTPVQAWRQVTALSQHPADWTPNPTERHAAILDDLLASAARHHNDVTDAHLAALAIEHDLTLVSTDRDFARYPGLRWLNPIA